MMANGDLLRQLFRSYAKKDDVGFRSVAENIIQEERAKNHRLLAEELESILLNGVRSSENRFNGRSNFFELPKDKDKNFPLIDIAQFNYDWERLVLPPKPLNILKQVTQEHYKRDLLASGGIKPKQKILFYGPPGCGKTLTAQVIAGVLHYPLVTVRFDAVVSSYLGETAANLRRVFDFIQQGQWVVLFDEFDAIGKDRNNPYEHGELKRVVNTLLQLMDAFKGESLLIAATNHEALLDTAIWRRFEAVIPFNYPKEQDRILLFGNFLKAYDISDINIQNIARNLKGATGADIEFIAVEMVRNALLDLRKKINKEDVQSALSTYKERATIVQKLFKEQNINILADDEKENFAE